MMDDIDRRIQEKNNQLYLLNFDLGKVREEIQQLQYEREHMPSSSTGGRDRSLDAQILQKLGVRMRGLYYEYKNESSIIRHGDIVYKIFHTGFDNEDAMIQTSETSWLYQRGLCVSSFARRYLYLSRI